MDDQGLGREYADGESICRQGEPGDRMYIIQAGRATVVGQVDGKEIVLAQLGAGDIFGEMALIDRKPRSATVRAQGRARVLSLDKRTFLRNVHEDPSLAYRILHTMCERLRRLGDEIARLRDAGAHAAATTSRRRYVIVASRDRRDAHERLLRECADDPQVEVVVDRRATARRRQAVPHEPERRHAERRRAADGWTIHLAGDNGRVGERR